MIIYKKRFLSGNNIQLVKSLSRQKLIESIAKLDIEFQQGLIIESQYKKNRTLLKKQLVEEITNIEEDPINKKTK